MDLPSFISKVSVISGISVISVQTETIIVKWQLPLALQLLL